jgi:hypothetical protein
MLKKNTKSLQNLLNEVELKLNDLIGKDDFQSISKSAYTKAREKFNYGAFIELYGDIRDSYYELFDVFLYKGFRLLAVDGSIISLPNEEDVAKEFSPTITKTKKHYKNNQVVQARASVMYDVLNNIVIDATLQDYTTQEQQIVQKHHLKHLMNNDLLIMDRGYGSYELFAKIIHQEKSNFLVRMKSNVYKKHIAVLFDKNSNINDITVMLEPTTRDLEKKLKAQNLPTQIKVRFVKVILDDGSIEVLATSVLDKDVLETKDFKQLYFQRWGIEVYYEILKNRLALENFTGKTALSVKQDFYSTILVSNIETLLTYEANYELKERYLKGGKKYCYKVNKSISFSTIKDHYIEMFFDKNNDIEKTINKLTTIFITDPVPIRPNRHFKRPKKEDSKNVKAIKSMNYYKRRKKNAV